MSARCLRAAAVAVFLTALFACGGGGSTGGGGSSSPTLSITTASILPAALHGQTYTTTLSATGGKGALHWTISPTGPGLLFVDGLSIDANTGVLSGTANFSGTGGFIAQVSDSSSPAQTVTKSFTVTAYGPIAVTSSLGGPVTIPEFNQLFVFLNTTGALAPVKYFVSAGSLPLGVTLDVSQSGAQLVGSPSALGTYQATITAQDSFSPPQSASVQINLTVTTASLVVANSLPSRIALNRPFSGTVVVRGGTPPYSLTVGSSTLPPGLTGPDSNGVISGTPTTAGTYNFTMSAKDAGSPQQTAFQFFTMVVAPPLGRNDSVQTATRIGNGSIQASISPYLDPPANGTTTAGDSDYYKLVAQGGATVHVETTAKRINTGNPLDTVIEIVDESGARLSTCRQPGDTSTNFTSSCLNDDISATPHVQDSALDYQVPGSTTSFGTFYLHVLDWRGDARPDQTYSLQVTGALNPLNFFPSTAPNGRVGATYTLFVSANGGSGTLTLEAGNDLPSWLTFTPSPGQARLTGTPDSAGTFIFTIRVTDQLGETATQTYTITITP